MTGIRNLRHGRRDHQAGFSMIEVLVAMVLLLVVMVGLLPLFSRSVLENIQGRESTQAGNHGRTELENFIQLGFNNWQLDITAGTELTSQMFYTQGSQDQLGDESWVASPAATEIAPWQRDTAIRQMGINGVRDNNLDGIIDQVLGLEDDDYDGVFDNLLAAGTIPGAIHLKQVEVQLQGQKNWGVGGPPTQLRVQYLKAF